MRLIKMNLLEIIEVIQIRHYINQLLYIHSLSDWNVFILTDRNHIISQTLAGLLYAAIFQKRKVG